VKAALSLDSEISPHKNHNIEISMECSPEAVHEHKLKKVATLIQSRIRGFLGMKAVRSLRLTHILL
jgi:coproporphyrinogen III oxidase-like Fe-S oxidoreductase